MQTPSRPHQDPTRTYSQTEAAALVGVSQRVLVDRGKKKGYLPKLYHCFPGQFWQLVAVGSITEQSKIRLTSKGIEELRDLIQNCSPEPPQLDGSKQPIRENGAVVKLRLPSPRCTLQQYAESAWFLNGIDGAAEHKRLELELLRSPSSEQIREHSIDAELVDSGEIVSVSGSSGSAIERVFDGLECIDNDFWLELERRKQQGKLQGRLLKAVELQARVEGEVELESEYLERAKQIANRKKTG